MRPPLAAPPAPQLFLSVAASASSCAGASGSPVITETPLPPRPATSRPTRTRTELVAAPFFGGLAGEPVRLGLTFHLLDRRHVERCALFVDETSHAHQQGI